jgi:hypothetical protein
LSACPGVSHWVQQEAPEKVNAILREWLTARALSAGRIDRSRKRRDRHGRAAKVGSDPEKLLDLRGSRDVSVISTR